MLFSRAVPAHTRTGTPGIALLLLAATIAPSAWASTGSDALFATPTHVDGREFPGDPLDISSVAFGQEGATVRMEIHTAGTWQVAALQAGTGQSLCVKLFYGMPRTPRSRVCVQPGAKQVAVHYTRLDPFGGSVSEHYLSTLFHIQRDSAVALFTPLEVGLRFGRYHWQAESQWTGGDACPVEHPCIDRLPDKGSVPSLTSVLAVPRCFGATARGEASCTNPRLQRSVIPTPDDALILPNAYCTLLPGGDPSVCRFRAPPANEDAPTIALIGDSHAAHWRGALNVVAAAKGWRGLSMTRSGCPFIVAHIRQPVSRRRSCYQHNRDVLRWLRQHPDVHTIFLSQHTQIMLNTPPRLGQVQAATQGYLRIWQQLPSSVKHVFVIRDPPFDSLHTPDCIRRALAHHRLTRGICPRSRVRALLPDAEARAARITHSRRFTLIDFTRVFCDRTKCFPVVGSALVHKDGQHLTESFSQSLGPALFAQVTAALAHGR
jgi:hypothetical protein